MTATNEELAAQVQALTDRVNATHRSSDEMIVALGLRVTSLEEDCNDMRKNAAWAGVARRSLPATADPPEYRPTGSGRYMARELDGGWMDANDVRRLLTHLREELRRQVGVSNHNADGLARANAQVAKLTQERDNALATIDEWQGNSLGALAAMDNVRAERDAAELSAAASAATNGAAAQERERALAEATRLATVIAAAEQALPPNIPFPNGSLADRIKFVLARSATLTSERLDLPVAPERKIDINGSIYTVAEAMAMWQKDLDESKARAERIEALESVGSNMVNVIWLGERQTGLKHSACMAALAESLGIPLTLEKQTS